MPDFVRYGESAPSPGLVPYDIPSTGVAAYDSQDDIPAGFEVIYDPRQNKKRELRPPAPPPVARKGKKK